MRGVKSFFRKHRKKMLVLYIGWCVVKGLLFLLLGAKLFS